MTAHWALGCRDFSRVDMILDDQGVPQILEVNTIPGFTSHSLVPMAARQAGVEMPELVDRIVRLAMERERCVS
jgi:D-alanine-D-alanine ligase